MNAPATAPLRRDWFYWLLAVYAGLHLIWIGALLVDFVLHPWAPDTVYGSPAGRLLNMLLIAPVALTVVPLVLRRAPNNVVGLCLLLWVANFLGGTLRAGSPLLPYNGLNTGWVGLWLLPLYFPDGRAQPARLASLVRGLSALAATLSLTGPLLFPSQQSAGRADLVNQLYVPALAPLAPLYNLLFALALGGTLLLILPSLLLRYRASGPHARQQLKWLMWGFGVLLASLLPLNALGFFSNTPGHLTGAWRLADNLLSLGFVLFPFLTVGYAILRHRLYDIDLVIRRTLVYSLLTALLAAIYFGSIVALEALARALLVQADSPVVVVASTLLIAALSAPLRRRVQAVIDRRLYRRKYDAARTLAVFGATLRDDVDLSRLSEHLVDVVDETMQPVSVGLWLTLAAGPRRVGPEASQP